MEEIGKLLEESSCRLKDIANLIKENTDGNVSDLEISKLYEIAKEMDNVKQQSLVQRAAIIHSKSTLSEIEEPWNCDIKQIFQENLEKQNQKKKKNNEEFYNKLHKHLNQNLNQDSEEMEVVEEKHTHIDPWTKQPIQQSVQSKTCKHMYDKRSIVCIISSRKQFKCPYVGCQNVIQESDLVYLD